VVHPRPPAWKLPPGIGEGRSYPLLSIGGLGSAKLTHLKSAHVPRVAGVFQTVLITLQEEL